MAKYMLARGMKRMPIDGIREIPREGLPSLRQAETVVFEAGKVVETDLDFGTWVTDGTLIRIRENNEPPRPPVAPPAPAPAPAPLLPLPVPAEVEIVKEAAPEPHEVPAPPPAAMEPDPTLSISTRPRTDKKKRR